MVVLGNVGDMSEKLECPVCSDSFAPSGFPTHVRSHNKDPIVEAVVELVTTRTSTGSTASGSEIGDSAWQTVKTQREQVNRLRAERDQRVRMHLNALNRMSAETLE